MILTEGLISQGFLVQNVSIDDLNSYIEVKRTCYRKYINEYYGGWIEDIQIKMNTEVFLNMMKNSCFQKIILNNLTVGFFSYNESLDRIDQISIQIIKLAQHKGIGSLYLQHITTLSKETNKPIILKVFKSNPAQNLYKRFNFEICSETSTHYIMKKLLIQKGFFGQRHLI